MNNKLIKSFLISVLSFTVQSAFANTFYSVDRLSKLAAYNEAVNVAGRYALPLNKVHIESCQRESLFRHPGLIQKQQILHRREDFWVRFEIQAYSGSEWFTLCSLETGQIIREQQLTDATSEH
ncbi:MAG: hypothetical protein ACXWFI_01150 [Methylobacter sp.]